MTWKRLVRIALVTSMIAVLLGGAGVAAAPASHESSDVYWFTDASLVDGAWSTLLRTNTGVRMTLHTSQLDPGAAYTVWWVIFNDPDACTHGSGLLKCGEGDLLVFGGAEAVMSSVLAATGHVVGNAGIATFGAHLRVGQLTSDVLWGPGLLYPHQAEIHLVVRSHGTPIPGMVSEQIHTFMGGCEINTCEDQQFATYPGT